MNQPKEVRTGGRSARVQESIHSAVRQLLKEHERANVTVPMVATLAGVTPSTIYRRWGDLNVLLADVALERMRPDTEPLATGSLRGDIQAWAEQYLDEMNSEPGRNMMRDVQSSPTKGTCVQILGAQLRTILERHRGHVDQLPDIDRLLNVIVAPAVFRILFAEAPLTLEQLNEQIDLALGQ